MIKFNRVAIRDPWVNNIEGATLLVPDGWTLEGGFHWMPLFYIQATLLFRASDPRAGAAVETLPLQQYVWSFHPSATPMPVGQNWNGSINLNPPRHPAEFVQTVWVQGAGMQPVGLQAPLRHLSGARLERVDDLPQVAAETARAVGGTPQVWATRLRYAYGFGGRGWEEDVYTTLVFGPSHTGLMIWHGTGYTMRAPAGELDRLAPQLSVPAQTWRFTLDWSATLEYVRQLFQQGRRQEMENTAHFGQMLAQYREQMREAHRQVYEERQASHARQNFARREILGGVETYVDPFDSRPVELPVGYRDYWVNNKGQVICSNEAAFDPRSDNAAEWRHMERYAPHGQPPSPWSW